MLTLVAHLSLVDSNRIAAMFAIFGKHRIETTQTVWFSVAHDVPLAAQLIIAFRTREMLHMPSSSFGFGAFVREDYLRNNNQPSVGGRRCWSLNPVINDRSWRNKIQANADYVD